MRETYESGDHLGEATGTYSKAKLKEVKLFLQWAGAYAATAAIPTRNEQLCHLMAIVGPRIYLFLKKNGNGTLHVIALF